MLKNRLLIMLSGTAEVVARQSYSTRRHVGAVICKDDRIIATGFNGRVRGTSDHNCEDDDGKTRDDVIHAEANALDNLLRGGGESTMGSIMVVTLSPCRACALRIINAGIKDVYYTTEYRDTTGIDLLRESGVRVWHAASTK